MPGRWQFDMGNNGIIASQPPPQRRRQCVAAVINVGGSELPFAADIGEDRRRGEWPKVPLTSAHDGIAAMIEYYRINGGGGVR